MQGLHKPESRAWIDPEVISVRHFKEQWVEASISEITDYEDLISRKLKYMVPEERYQEIENMCRLETMRCDNQDKLEVSKNMSIASDVKLKTLKKRAEVLAKRKGKPIAQGSYYSSRRFHDFPVHKAVGSLKNLEEEVNFEAVQKPEVVLSVQLYVPEKKNDIGTGVTHQKTPAFQIDFEFSVLGNQYLTELRDKIQCVSDIAIPGEVSECPDFKSTVTCKDLYKSGFFYINGVFYNDMRDKDAKDYSDVIIKWAKKNRDMGPFRKLRMERTKFVDLEIQLGYPYVYTHQGDCEHLMIFSDLRMFGKSEEQNKNAYPIHCIVKACKRFFCMVCRVFSAVWVVRDNPRLPYNTFFFCNKCYRSFNYDENGEKIGDFTAYHLPDRTKLA